MIPISLVRLKNSKQDGKSKILLYAYGAYKHSVSPSFSVSRFSLVDQGTLQLHVEEGVILEMFGMKKEKEIKKIPS